MDYPLLNIFWTMFEFFMWILWFMLLFQVIGDLFRNDTMSGIGKAGWTVVLILLPFVGVLIYLISQGRGMSERQAAREQRSQEAFRASVREAAEPQGSTDELVKLAQLKNDGYITSAEFETAKSKVLL